MVGVFQFLLVRWSFFLCEFYRIPLQEIIYSENFLIVEMAFFFQQSADFRNGEKGMHAVTFAFKHFLAALLSVQNHHDIRYGDAFVFNFRNGFQKGFPARNHIFYQQTVLAFGKDAFNHFFGSVIFRFFSFDDEWKVTLQRHGGSHRKCGIRNAADEIEIIQRKHFEQIIGKPF